MDTSDMDNIGYELKSLYRKLRHHTATDITWNDVRVIKQLLGRQNNYESTDTFGRYYVLSSLKDVEALLTEVGFDRNMVIALLLNQVECHDDSVSQCIATQWGADVVNLIQGLQKVRELYRRHTALANENFRNLMLTFAQDIRVIILMIVDRLVLMRDLNHHPDQVRVADVARESVYLYAQLAHRLGLYKIKGELEDMSLKYTDRDIYTRIANKLNETKRDRDAYIANFISPVKAALLEHGLNFEIKGRTKSIYSIWNKMQKQHTDIEGIYDLFAIRIILDADKLKERSDCWLAYSLITDMFQPNPARMKDWLSVPKSNGYESLHITVLGPQGKWVEVQIRTKRMDEIAEKGVAAHWRYKGIKSENNLDTWMNKVRDMLEDAQSGPLELMKNMKLDIYNKEVFVFTPRGDLYKLPLGATVLDFAFNIHSSLGCVCTGAKVNGKTKRIDQRLRNGDTVEILTSSTQTPKTDWLKIVVTSKARNKIRQAVKERENKAAELAKELLQRRFKNRKIEPNEAYLMKVIKSFGFKTSTDFYSAVAAGTPDINAVISEYEKIERGTIPDTSSAAAERTSADQFVMQQHVQSPESDSSTDVLVIGNDVKGLNYKLSRCCMPVYGDDVFGFISSEGVVKIHRRDCPNAAHILDRYPYRIITTRWSGKAGTQLTASLRVVGTDDIGIVTNISSIINKESGASLRNISIDSHDGIFQGYLVIGVDDSSTLKNLIKKIATVKGVKNVERSN